MALAKALALLPIVLLSLRFFLKLSSLSSSSVSYLSNALLPMFSLATTA